MPYVSTCVATEMVKTQYGGKAMFNLSKISIVHVPGTYVILRLKMVVINEAL